MRYLFTFRYQKVYRYVGGIYSGLCLTAIFYFLIVKGAKGASFMTPALIAWLDANTETLMWSFFLTITVVFQILIWFWNFNALRIVILAGTFALAFAFAGNDLVNFVGVPLAAMQSAGIAASAEAANPALTPTTLYMGALKESVVTPTIWLIISGLIMVCTLWFSPKAQRVVQTAINLSASERSEKNSLALLLAPVFWSAPASVSIESSIRSCRVLCWITSTDTLKTALEKGEVPLPFDQVRASVNLVLASILIATATSMKLPLSTTYVTFMVAMGSSLADGAWDRETAVYRISGVMAVISGWFLTAFTAFIAAGIAVLLCIWFGPIFMVIGGVCVVALLVRSNFFSKDKKVEAMEGFEAGLSKEELRKRFNAAIDRNLKQTIDIFSNTTMNFLSEDYSAVKKTSLRLRNS